MAIKKSELYSSLWKSCDELRGGMDASQYKDYVLVLLFIKYVSDKYAGMPYAPVTIPEGAGFKDMVALKGKPDIGDQINKKIIGPLASANKLSDMPDFNDAGKLGSGKEMVDRLTNLIAIFEHKALDFSKNLAGGDDILGDAYEFLMRHFAVDSGKSKGQFYTPSEVSLIMARIIGIREAKTSSNTTAYDPTCGSGSLILKVGDEAPTEITLYGQEKDAATSVLARMNMILHNNPTALIVQGNTLADPKFKEGDSLKTFDYVVANFPFSDKRWSNGVDTENDPYDRFKYFGTPPDKQGDYAYLLHIVRSLKSTGKGACILPHGVLFRGNAEADIRRNLIRKGYIKGIIGLPANLFYGTGIPACIILIDKEEARTRKGIFMLDASAGYMKDGNKNRLRAMDIHKIVDVFNKRLEIPKYARMVGFDEIEKNDYNLNLPRYIDSQEPEDLQDIEGHLRGGIPLADIDALQRYWLICPHLKAALFKDNRPGYQDLAVDKAAIKTSIYQHPEFAAFITGMNDHFDAWRQRTAATLKTLKSGCQPKQLIGELSEDLLSHYTGKALIDKYDVYQHLMDYWAETMQDDCYLIAADDWKAETYRIIETDKKGKQKDKGWTCDLVPKALVVGRYFADEQQAITQLQADLEAISAELSELEEEHSGEDAVFASFDKINKLEVSSRIKEIANDPEAKDEIAVLKRWLTLSADEAALKKALKDAEAELDAQAYSHYPKLNEADIKTLVVDDKWLATLDAAIHGEMDRISQQLTQRVKQLAERYETPVPQINLRVDALAAKVNGHLQRMGFAWN
ncbi:type I restriction-modification system subunit M [Methylicorpusculum sp.]|uniref:type I restriction-modification system subunit M n=1 Tax=Methylicorpusculum sp. TaxID=2713644 RepID=UPI002731682D|nr:class I SAM-dependent DNA methyltransferase [Methylicorpusculum sp.]MDP2177379.1 class I SAM-dependent DNA methyltransferase [Methylicorpusculum sp.]MDP3530974.1 class I SAM-dependent DNA methyltransferase [Methylicorpusculum sp.]MDZ4151725.1 class I SAM-dependent DNA methyltransferase [Methylicorpusculum sp.]